jgi:HSP20 family protein
VQLPFAADSEQVRASFENGVLAVTVPKSDQQQRMHRIDVQAGAGTPGGELLLRGRGLAPSAPTPRGGARQSVSKLDQCRSRVQ